MSIFSFNEADTRIFQFSRGERDEQGRFKTVYGDPRVIQNRLDFELPDYSQILQQYAAGEAAQEKMAALDADYERMKASVQPGDPELPPKEVFASDLRSAIKMGVIAHGKLCKGVRMAFDLPDLDPATGNGCTENMVIAVMNAFIIWNEKKSGNTPPTPTSSPLSPDQSISAA